MYPSLSGTERIQATDNPLATMLALFRLTCHVYLPKQPRSRDQRHTELRTTFQMSWHSHDVVSDGKRYRLGAFLNFLDIILKVDRYPFPTFRRFVMPEDATKMLSGVFIHNPLARCFALVIPAIKMPVCAIGVITTPGVNPCGIASIDIASLA